MKRLLWLLVLSFALSACAAEPSAQDLVGAGGSTPNDVVENFLEDLNQALRDPSLADQGARRAWAERLASHFAPSERSDQRLVMGEMLAGFAASAVNPAVGSRATLELSFSGTEVIRQGEGRALVRVVDGLLTLNFLDAEGMILRTRTAGLTDVIGQTSGGLPTIQVGRGWFLTEG
ncbi:MAG: hypothetical protein AB4911_08715 [Oscillochloridaceae bacterium umkhey_bin13]